MSLKLYKRYYKLINVNYYLCTVLVLNMTDFTFNDNANFIVILL